MPPGLGRDRLEPMDSTRDNPTACTVAAWILAGVMLVLVLFLHLLPALLAGLLVYELVHLMAPALDSGLSNRRAKLIVVALLATVVVAAVTAAIIGAAIFLKSDASNLSNLLTQLADVVTRSRATLPAWIGDQIPADPGDLRNVLGEWLHVHADDMESLGKETGRGFIHAIVGMIVGAMIALQAEFATSGDGPLARELALRASKLGSAFRRVVFAQVSISLFNTLFTGIYLLLLLPSFEVNLPLRKTLLVITFIAGLLPVLGNLISNTIIVIVSLSHSPEVALASIAFLVVIHKLEYFLNARIIGRRIHARAWELLLAMLAMEAAFGIAGVVAAPIYYCFVKDELAERRLI